MSFSLSHQKSKVVKLGELSREQFLVLAVEAAQQADWSIGHTSAHGFSAFTGFSLSSFSEEVSVEIQEETALIKSECLGTQLYDWGKNKRNLREFQVNFAEVKQNLSSEELATRYHYLKEENGFLEDQVPEQTAKASSPNFFSLFVPARGYFITPILLNLNLLIYIANIVAVISGYEHFFNWGANFQPKTLDGQIWRILTCCFLHSGIIHLLMNMITLVYIGSLLEPLIGRKRFLLAYLGTGLLASLTSVWWHSVNFSVGASGAIFGLYGVFLALLSSNYIEPSARKAFFTSIGIFVGYNLLDGLGSNQTDNAAHFGGFLAGIAFGFAFLPALRNRADKVLARAVIWIPAMLVLIIIAAGYFTIPNNLKLYEEKVNQFKANEAKAREVFEISSSVLQDPEQTKKVTAKGQRVWQKNLKITEEIAKLDLSAPYYEKNDLMRNYAEIRIKNYQLMQKIADSNDPEPYRRLYKRYNANIRWCMLQLNENQIPLNL